MEVDILKEQINNIITIRKELKQVDKIIYGIMMIYQIQAYRRRDNFI